MNQPATEAVIATVQTDLLISEPPSNITLLMAPLPTREAKGEACFPFVPTKEDDIIAGPAPWRLIRKKPNCALILVHEDNFPINYSTNVLCHQIITAMLTITSLAQDRYCLVTQLTHGLHLRPSSRPVLPCSTWWALPPRQRPGR